MTLTAAATSPDCHKDLVRLHLWGAYLLFIPWHEVPTVHLVGLNVQTGRTRVSSAVKLVHVAERRVVTASGRTYEMMGKPGRKAFCLQALRAWKPSLEAVVAADVTITMFDGANLIARAMAAETGWLH